MNSSALHGMISLLGLGDADDLIGRRIQFVAPPAENARTGDPATELIIGEVVDVHTSGWVDVAVESADEETMSDVQGSTQPLSLDAEIMSGVILID